MQGDKEGSMRRAVQAAASGTGARITERHYKQATLTGGLVERRDIIAETTSYRLTVSMSKDSVKLTLLVKEGTRENLARIAASLEDRGLIVTDVDEDRLVAGISTRSAERVERMLRGMNDVLRRVTRSRRR